MIRIEIKLTAPDNSVIDSRVVQEAPARLEQEPPEKGVYYYQPAETLPSESGLLLSARLQNYIVPSSTA